jgi:Pentapeptide repeats (8 copies)
MAETNPQAENQNSESTPPSKLSKQRLEEILNFHGKWLASEDFRNWNKAPLENKSKYDNLRANLEHADLSNADLEAADLRRARLQNAFLVKANLAKARLANSNLEGAQLNAANLRGADFLRSPWPTPVNVRITRLTSPQIKKAIDWDLAFYAREHLKELGLGEDHNETLPLKLTELAKKEVKQKQEIIDQVPVLMK